MFNGHALLYLYAVCTHHHYHHFLHYLVARAPKKYQLYTCKATRLNLLNIAAVLPNQKSELPYITYLYTKGNHHPMPQLHFDMQSVQPEAENIRFSV